MATAAGSSAESEALKIAFDYLVNSIDTAALLPKALSSQLISERQKSECASEPEKYNKAEKFVDHLQRAVNGDSNKYHTFIQVLKETDQASIARRLGDELAKVSRLMPSGEQLIVPSDELLEELAGLRISYARFLRRYKKVLQDNAEAQEEFVETVPGVIHRELGPDHSFQSYFNTLIDEEVSLFNITYLKKFCDIFPDDVCTATKELVDKYEKQRQHFMASTTLNQFKQLFPASATTSAMLSAGKVLITVKLKSYWGDNTVEELTTLVNNLDVPGSHLHLYNVHKGCIAAIWLCPAVDFKELRGAIEAAADSLESKGVLRVFAGEGEVMWVCSRSDQVSGNYVLPRPALHVNNSLQQMMGDEVKQLRETNNELKGLYDQISKKSERYRTTSVFLFITVAVCVGLIANRQWELNAALEKKNASTVMVKQAEDLMVLLSKRDNQIAKQAERMDVCEKHLREAEVEARQLINKIVVLVQEKEQLNSTYKSCVEHLGKKTE